MPRISKDRKEAIRARILRAGLRAFEQDGFRRASMNGIATAAGLSSGAIYTYFASKEELFLRAFAALVEADERALVAAIAAEPSVERRIRIAIDFFVDAVVAPPDGGLRGAGGGVLLHAWATAAESPMIREQLLFRREQFQSLAASIIEDALESGELPPGVDVAGLAGAIGSMLDGLIVQRAEKGDRFGRDDARRQAYALVDLALRRA